MDDFSRKIYESPCESIGFDCKGRYSLSADLVSILAWYWKFTILSWNCMANEKLRLFSRRMLYIILVMKNCDFIVGIGKSLF